MVLSLSWRSFGFVIGVQRRGVYFVVSLDVLQEGSGALKGCGHEVGHVWVVTAQMYSDGVVPPHVVVEMLGTQV